MTTLKKILLYSSAAIVLAAAAGAIFRPGADAKVRKADKPAKYIFVMIGDGMGATQVAAAESYFSYKAGKLGGEQVTFTKFPVLGLCTTYSADSNITDSAASGTAIATGNKTNNHALGTAPDGSPLKSMAYTLHEKGYNVGIMSSVPVNHATPGAFYAHQKDRNSYYEISLEIPESGFEFFAGSGILDFNGKDGKLEDIDKVLERKGYDVCYGLDELAASEDESGVVVIPASQKKEEALNYEIEREDDPAKEDRLSEVLEAAIGYLGDDEPFFIMCEGGEIDWAAHDNNVTELIDAISRFDEAVAVAYDFYLEHPDETLIVVTADHETGGITIGANKGYMVDWAGIENDSLPEEENMNAKQKNRAFSAAHNIGWTTFDHTGAPVPVYAIGKGAEKFGGRIDNTDIYGKVVCE
mgnify:CR=1 FL=1